MKPCAHITQSGGVHTLPTVLDEVTTFKPTSVSFEYLVLNLTSTQFFFSGGVACNYVMYFSCFSGFITIVMRIELEIENNPSVDTTASLTTTLGNVFISRVLCTLTVFMVHSVINGTAGAS